MSANLTNPDFELRDEGTIWLLLPLCKDAKHCEDHECSCPPAAWIEEHIPEEVQRWSGNGVVIEHRYVDNWVDKAREAGFSLQTYKKGGGTGGFLEGK